MSTSTRGSLHCSEKRAHGAVSQESSPLALSVVMPCLNEADTLETCIKKAQKALRESQISGEIIIADHGSTDDLRPLLLNPAGAVLIGIELLLEAMNQWRFADFGPLAYTKTMRLVAPGVTLRALGLQTILSSFFVSILGMRRR